MDRGDTPVKSIRKKIRSPRSAKRMPKKSLDILTVDVQNENDRMGAASDHQLVLYNSEASNPGQVVPAVPDPADHYIGSFQSFSAVHSSSRVLPSVGAFTVQCAACFKWRIIPTKEKYEEIRENILQEPFVCDRAREWRPDISCDDLPDISQDSSRLWAIDKPNISQPPPGWDRSLRIRGEGSTKFADIYYIAPSGKSLRSMVEIQRYLLEHPEYIQSGVNLSQFSFQIPKPLQENYVRKRPAKPMNLYNASGPGLSMPLEPCEVNPIAWAEPPTRRELQLGRAEPQVGGPGLSAQLPTRSELQLGQTELQLGGPGLSTQPPTRSELQLGGPGLSTLYSEHPGYHHPIELPPQKNESRDDSGSLPSSVYNQPIVKLEDCQQGFSRSPREL